MWELQIAIMMLKQFSWGIVQNASSIMLLYLSGKYLKFSVSCDMVILNHKDGIKWRPKESPGSRSVFCPKGLPKLSYVL